MFDIAVVVGSLRKESINRKLAVAMGKLRPEKLDLRLVSIADVPLYNQELEAELPAGVVAYKDSIFAANAVLFVTPEYNRGIPGVLKNAIDWGTRPRGTSCWNGKPAAVVGASEGRLGTAVAQSHLRSVLPAIGVPLMGLPEIYFQWKPDGIDEAGGLVEESAREMLGRFLDRFTDWIARHTPAK